MFIATISAAVAGLDMGTGVAKHQYSAATAERRQQVEIWGETGERRKVCVGDERDLREIFKKVY